MNIISLIKSPMWRVRLAALMAAGSTFACSEVRQNGTDRRATLSPVTINRTDDFLQHSASVKKAIRTTNPQDTGDRTVDLGRPGPFSYQSVPNLRLTIDPWKAVTVDAWIPKVRQRSPLVIITHGNNSSKEAHSGHAEHLASWGFHAITVQLPRRDKWIANGETIRQLANILAAAPAIVSENVDPDAIILAGHSFGGSAISIAAAQGAKVRGLIYLDPALVSKEIRHLIKNIRVPTMLLGADPAVFKARQRAVFFRDVAGEAGEITVRGATHDDAQNPSVFSFYGFGTDPFTSVVQRRTFTEALTATALSLALDRNLDLAWDHLERAVRTGRIVNPRKKDAS